MRSHTAAQRKSPLVWIAEWTFLHSGLLLFWRWYRLQVRGIDHLPTAGPYLVVANHTSHLDGGAIVAALGIHYTKVYSLGARDYFYRNRSLSWLSRRFLNIIPIDRRWIDQRTIDACRRVAAGGGVLLMFPEGTRSVSGRLQPFKSGFGLIALELRLPIVPVYVDGTYAALPKGKLIPHRTRITVTFGAVVHPDSWAHGSDPTRTLYRRIAGQMYSTVDRLREESESAGALDRAFLHEAPPVR